MSGLRKIFQVADLLRQKPRTNRQLCDEVDSREHSIRYWLKEMEEHGWIERAGYSPSDRGIKPTLWKWRD